MFHHHFTHTCKDAGVGAGGRALTAGINTRFSSIHLKTNIHIDTAARGNTGKTVSYKNNSRMSE